jgi:hypothetical protein
MSDGYIYVVCTRRLAYYLLAIGKPKSIYSSDVAVTRYVKDARLFFERHDARKWCEGRKGWRTVRIARLVPEFIGATVNSGFKKP